MAHAQPRAPFLQSVGGPASTSDVSLASASPVSRDPVKLERRAEDVVDERYDQLSWVQVRDIFHYPSDLPATLRLLLAGAAHRAHQARARRERGRSGGAAQVGPGRQARLALQSLLCVQYGLTLTDAPSRSALGPVHAEQPRDSTAQLLRAAYVRGPARAGPRPLRPPTASWCRRGRPWRRSDRRCSSRRRLATRSTARVPRRPSRRPVRRAHLRLS